MRSERRSSSMTDKKQNPAEIFLVEVFDGGDYSNVWCDTPAPGEGMDPADAIKYVRADLVPESNEVLARRIVDLTADRDRTKYKLSGVLDEISDFCASLDGALIDGQGADELVDDMNLRLTHHGLTDADRKFNPFNQSVEKTTADYLDLQRQHDELQTMLFNERQKAKELAAQVEQLKGYIVALTHADETGYVEDVGFVENYSEIQSEVEAIVAAHDANVICSFLDEHATLIVNRELEGYDAETQCHNAMFELHDIANKRRQQAKAGSNG
jgi:hypothetical protein